MADRFEISVSGTERLQAVFQELGAEAPRATGDALYQWGASVMQDSRANYVPVDTGVLRASGHVEQPVVRGTQASVRFGYGGVAAPYALSVHENPRAGKTGGVSPSGRPYRHWARVGEWKFLETPMKQHVRRLPLLLARALNTMLGTKTGRRASGFRFR